MLLLTLPVQRGLCNTTHRYHLSVAVKSTNFNLHCPHASQGGANVCVVPLADRQKAFCKQYVAPFP